MAIRKSDLRKFIEKKAQKRKDVLWKSAHAIVEAAFKPIVFEVYKSVGPVERLAQQFHDSLLEMQNEHARFQQNWNINRLISDTDTYVIGIRNDIVQQQTTLALHNLLTRGTNDLFIDLEPIIPLLKEQLSKTIAEYQALSKLSDEILTIVDSSHNGDMAYKRLEELGVDLSDFDAGSSNLPAVIKLSVDPCLINGNCG